MRSSTKHLTRHALLVVAMVGAVLAMWPVGQTAYGRWQQQKLRAAWDAAEKSPPAATVASPKPTPAAAAQPVASRKTQPTRARWPQTRLVIPDIAVDVVVVQGMDQDALRQGPGHARQSALPGQAGNCVIAGHRNVYGAWFYRFDELLPGAVIELRTLRHTYTYRMIGTTNISDADTTFLDPPTNPRAARLTLITCTLPHTATRMVVQAELVSST